MPSIITSGSRVQSADQQIAVSTSTRSRRRQFLLATVLTTGLFTTLGLTTKQAQAVEECGGIPNTGGSFTVACGQGPFNSGINYRNQDTDDAGSTIFTFSNTQAFGTVNVIGGQPNAVSLSSNEAGHSITVEVSHIPPGPVPLFDAGSAAFGGLGNAQGFVVLTSGATSAISYTVENGTHLGGSASLGDVNALVLSTTGVTSGITAVIAAGTYTGGTTLLGNANGMVLSTGAATSPISLTMTGTVTGGSTTLGNANGLDMSTTGADSGVTAALTGSYTGGSTTLGSAHGVVISTTGTNSSVVFGLNGNGSTISGGTSPLSSADGVRITTSQADSNITFNSAAGTTISGANGNGVTLHATGGGSILAGNTINGTVNGGLTIGGVGLGAGFVGTAVGAGVTDIHVGTTGIVNGTGAGLIGTAVDGNVTLLNEGQVNQTALVASSLNPFDPGYSVPFALLPVGMGGAATGTGSVIINTTVGSSVTQVGAQAITGIEGVGIVATTFLGSGNAQIIAAGSVTATGIGLWSNANSGTAVATAIGAVNVTGGAGGPAPYVDPYIIQSFSTVGVLAQSITGAATANLAAQNGNPASVNGADIGVAANVFAGTQNATVQVNGNNGGATVNANNTGLYAAVSILGTGNAEIIHTNATTTAPVAAAAVALNPASNALIINQGFAVLNGAVIAAAGLDATVDNTNNSQINIPALSAVVVAAGRDATIHNNTGSDITLAGPLSFSIMVAGQDATINNTNGGTTFTINGPVSANFMLAGRDASINNSNGALFLLDGPLTANVMVAGQDARISNYNGADFVIAGVADANVMVAGRNAIIENYNGGTFNMLGALNANVMVAGQDATITNYNGGEFNVVGALNANLMFAGRDATITNYNGGDFTVLGALNGNLMVAGQDARITNYNGGTFSLLGGGNGNLMTAGRDAFIDNSTGGQVNLIGLNGSLMVAGLAGNGGNAIVNNFDGGTFNFLGGNIAAMVAPNSAIFNNNSGSSVNMIGLNAISINGGDELTFHNTANFGGNNRQDCAGNLAGVCVTGVGIISGGAIGQTLNFNNAGGLVSMINQSSTTVTGAADFFFGITGLAYPQYNTAIGDVTVIGGNFNGSNKSQLGVDAFLAGPNNSSSDLMIVTGATSGKTGIIVNDLNGGPGSFNPVGIPVVAVVSGNTNKSDFFIDPSSSHYDPKFGGVIDKGLFFYSHQVKKDPFFNIANGFAANGIDHVLVSAPDSELFELSKAAEGARNIWFESTGVWLERTADLRNFLWARGGGVPAGAGADLPVYKAPPAPLPVRSITPGVWLKGLASWTDRDATDSTSVFGQSFTFDTSYKQKVFGVIGGIDGGWDYRDSVFMVGLLGGYLDSNLKFNASSNSIDYTGGTVGAYATYINRGLYIDTIFKADLLKMKWNANTLAAFGVAAPETDANSYGIQVDSGYRFFNGAFFWEPLGTLAWVRTTIDPITVLGQSLAFDDTDSVRGSLGGRVGVANYWGGWKVEASVTGRVWHEFEDPAPLVVNQGLLTIADQFKGTYGDVNGTLNFLSVATGWSSFLNGGIKWNSDFQTVSAKGGFRYNW